MTVRKLGLAAALLSSVTAGQAVAQGRVDGIFGLMGGMIAAAQAQAAQEAWARQSELRVYCLGRALARENLSVSRLVQAGVMPNDPRLNGVAGQCARFEPSALRTGYRCTVPDESGLPVPSTCNQSFARYDGSGRLQPVEARAALDAYFSTGAYLTTDVEDEEGRQERLRRAEGLRRIAEIARLRSDIEPYGSSRSEAVRSFSQGLIQKVALASNPAAPPPASAADAIRRDYQILVQLAQVELRRLDALDRLTAEKAAAERRLGPGTPPELRDEAARLAAEHAALAAQRTSPPKPPRTEASEAVGPSFDCAAPKAPLDRVVCSDPALSRLDLELVQPYYLMRHGLPDQRTPLKQEAVELSRLVLETCRIPQKGALSGPALKQASACVSAAYRRQRDAWRAQAAREMPPPARDEIARPVEEHLQLQRMLQAAGYLAAGERVDGVYGAGTRGALASFQAAEGLPADGIMSDATAERLSRRARPDGATPQLAAFDVSAQTRMADLQRRYAALGQRISDAEARRQHEERNAARVTQATAFAKEALAAELPGHVQASLSRFLAEAEAGGEARDPAALARLASEFDLIRPAAEEALLVAKATTAKNGFLVRGDLDGLLVLVNDTGRAPSVVRNLRGDLVFQQARTAACQPHAGLADPAATRPVNARLAAFGQSLRFPLPRCNMRGLAEYDLVVASRGSLLKEKPADLVALLSAVESGVFTAVATLSGEDVRAAAQAEAVRVLAIETGIEKGTAAGFGVLALATGSSVVCQVTGDDREAHEGVLRPHLARLTEELPGPATSVATTVDAAFIAAKRRQCGAVYASAGDLKLLTPALRRDEIGYRHLPVWIEPDQLEAARKAISDRRAAETQAEGDRRRRAEDEQRLAALKESDAALVKARREAELRQQYGAMARALEGDLTAEMKNFLEGRTSSVPGRYPAIRGWYAAQLQDRWELMTVETALLDYGISEFKGRSLETAFARTTVRMRNRVLGEYKEHCLITGFVSDKEFDMAREPIGVPCDEASRALEAYRQEQRFASRWHAP